ncbi:MAG: EAL domain-containing protein [Cyanobacteria bacterium P01_F01_bin.56]
MTYPIHSDSNYLADLPAFIQHELHNPLHGLQGAIRLLSTGRFGKLSQEGSQILHSAMMNLDRLTRLAIAVEEEPAALSSVLSPDQIRLFKLKHDLPAAIEQRDIYLNYQPIVCSQTQTVVGFEALARWEHPIYGAIAPTIFIPMAEESGLIHLMGQQLITEACQQLQQWQQSFPHQRSLTMSVNLSALQLSHLELADHVSQVLEETQINPQSLKLEITESALVENSQIVTLVLQRLRLLGVKLHLDDFGTGYSALSRLSALPIDTLKVDRTFVTNKNWEICEVILALSQKLHLNAIVEGVETQKDIEKLHSIGFQYMQGYYFSRPLNIQAATDFLSAMSSRFPGNLAELY